MSKMMRGLLLPIILLLSACGNLAGEVEIVQPVSDIAATEPQVEAAQPLQMPENPPDIANGQRIYAANCTNCHGNGSGNGELVENGDVPRMPSFLEASHVRQQSVEFYYDIITNGNIINLMPPWSGSLSVQERWDVLMYVYTLHYSEAQIAQGETLVDTPSTELSIASDAALAAQSGLTGEDAFAAVAYERLQSVQNWGANTTTTNLEVVNFSGVVSNGTAGASLPLPENVTIELQYGDFLDTIETQTTTMSADGQFSFTDIPVLPNSTYFAVAFYDGRAFVSERIASNQLQAQNSTNITLYETTNAPNIVYMTGLDLVVESLPVPDLGTGLVIGQVNTYENPTDYVFHLDAPGQDVRISLLVSIPVGSLILEDSQQRSLIPFQQEYSLIDTRPVYPGTHTVDTSYFLPYEGSAQTLDIVMNNRFEGDVSILVTVPQLTIVGDNFSLEDEINIGTPENPRMAKLYTGTFNLQSGQSIVFAIEGRLPQPTGSETAVFTQDEFVPILIGTGIVLLLIVAGVVVFLRLRNDSASEVERILNEISRLEAMHDAGRINHDAFQQKRLALTQRLKELSAESTTE